VKLDEVVAWTATGVSVGGLHVQEGSARHRQGLCPKVGGIILV